MNAIVTSCKHWWNMLHSPEGGYLIRRYISALGHVVVMVIVMKLTWMGGMTEGYFIAYCSFIAGHATLEKFIARKPKAPQETE